MRVAALVTALLVWAPPDAVLGSNAEGQKFLAENKEKEGVVTLPSGLQYKVIKSGPEGARSPNASSPCKCHYRGTLINGQEFDSSYKRHAPATFAPNQVVAGWTEALQLVPRSPARARSQSRFDFSKVAMIRDKYRQGSASISQPREPSHPGDLA